MRMMNPSVMVSRLDLVVLELAVAGIVFRRLPLGAPRWVVPPSGHPSGTSLAQFVPSSPEKFSKKFCCVWTPFGIDFLQSKKQAKNTTGTVHYVNRLVPKIDIKLLYMIIKHPRMIV